MQTEWLILIGTVGSNLLIGAYVYGRLTERVSGLTTRVNDLDSKVDNHTERIIVLEERRKS